MQITTATKKILALKKRIRAICGGTSASKTFSILLWLIDYCQSTKNEICTVVSESYPHLEKGAITDFKRIMKDQNYWRDDLWNETKHIYTFETGSVLEFFSVDTYSKAHGPRRDVLFVNEGNNMPYNIVDQLITRTRKIVWLDWNPTNEFWFYTDMQPNRSEDIDFITLTYKDNEALDEISVREIESHRNNKNWWKVYGEGKLGEVEGRIYTGWQIIDSVPHEARLERYGLDFGYSNDPAALVAIYFYNGGYIVDEITFQKGLTNKQIADIINEVPTALVKADSAEPKSIDEIKLYGVNIMPVKKGKDSVRQGITYVQAQRISITKRSVNVIKEYRNYMWMTDRDGNIINEPDHTYSHSMDAIRYGMEYLRDNNSMDVQAKTIFEQIKQQGEHW